MIEGGGRDGEGGEARKTVREREKKLQQVGRLQRTNDSRGLGLEEGAEGDVEEER
jgi:hypothetical protein